MKFTINSKCPCGSTKKYKECCGIFHSGSNPKDALTLMKSRYSAYIAGEAKYIIKTTHKDNPDFKDNIRVWTEEIRAFGRENKFLGLKILESALGADESFVSFEVSLEQNRQNIKLLEKSKFLKVNNIWLYHSGEIEIS